MKILFTGTIQSGKTTLLDHLKDLRIPRVAYVTEVAREIIDRSPELFIIPDSQIVLPNQGDFIFSEQKRRETEAESSGALVVVCDRGSLDIVAHSRVFGGQEKTEWIAWAKTYSQVFYFDKNDVTFNSNVYPPNRNWKDFRNVLDCRTKELLEENNLPYQLLSGDIEERIHIVESSIRKVIQSREGQQFYPEGYRHGKER